MKSAIYLGKEAIEIADVPLPEVGANDVLIQNLYSSICGTDVAVYSHDVCNTSTEDFVGKCKNLYGTAPLLNGKTANIDIFLDAAGAESILDSFIKQGKIGSRFVSVAVNNAIRQLDLLHMTYAQKSIIGSGGYLPEDVRDVLNIMESGKFDIESIITHEYSLSDLSEAIQTAADAQHSFNVVINFSKEQNA